MKKILYDMIIRYSILFDYSVFKCSWYVNKKDEKRMGRIIGPDAVDARFRCDRCYWGGLISNILCICLLEKDTKKN